HDDRTSERDTILRVLQCVLVRRARDADGLRADDRARRLEGRHRRLHTTALALPRPREPGVELLLAAEQAVARHADVVEDDLGGVRRADAHLLELLALAQPGRSRRDDEGRVA